MRCARCTNPIKPRWKQVNGVCEDCVIAILNGAPLIIPHADNTLLEQAITEEELMEMR